MQSDHLDRFYRTTLAALSPIVDTLRLMCGAIRHAFNRSSLAELEEVERLRDNLTLDIDEFFNKVEQLQQDKINKGNLRLIQLAGVLTHLEHIGAEISNMAGPVQRKIREAVMISDQDFYHLNDLFTRVKGLLRGLADLFHAENQPLKRYLFNEANNLIEGCFQRETEHETRMTQSFGQPHAFAIYLAILEQQKRILQHLIDIIGIVDKRFESRD
ncbi:hypothetical protein [Desulfobacca acetoxidans]|uniref:PhoU domain-containing protein n=1 Tax=Desulfobacca acetoxidans (strain ATCC 700848 / DSM 11109 / ASRB2) TaxID=880072 RepID=F2NH22_DESAR|nr:hypothetical protein [Desulfobacca acetoxidans]AEB08793.1 hypothetical protein Desac_0923 [Desulfobacca acetoxidans DSM 11109]HAY21226.1 hypothetical protein [Desulfobacterales bacterium]